MACSSIAERPRLRTRRGTTRCLCIALGGFLLLGAALLSAPAVAQGRADELLELLARRPRGMTIDTWREQRREAVRELGRLKERRAVPHLLQIIEKERFDVILEIAIDALGSIGDRRAVTPLKRLLDDPSLDAYVRDAAAGALRKLESAGGRPRPRPTPPRPTPKPETPPRPADPQDDGARPKARPGTFDELPKLDVPKLDVGTVARVTQLDLVVGAGQLAWDGRTERTTAGFGLRTRYRRQLEQRKLGYSFNGAADLDFDLADLPGQDTTWNLGHRLQIDPEIRFYPFSRDVPLLFGQISGGFGYGLDAAQIPATPESRVSFAGTVAIGGGPGYGRVIDIGERLRLRRVARVLGSAGLLKGELDLDVGNKLIQTWYSLRNEIGSFHRLGYTLRVLDKAGLLKSPNLDPAVVYRLIRILDDPQLENRLSGMMFRAGYGYARSLLKDADDVTLAYAYATAEYHLQRGTTRAFEADLRFFYNMWGTPDTFNVQGTASYAWYLYNRSFDPVGSLSLSLRGGLNNQHGAAFDSGGLAYTLLAGAGYARYFSRGSRVVAALRGGVENGGALVLLSIEGSYGFARGSFVTAE